MRIAAAFRAKAKACYNDALSLKPDWAEALSNLSVLQMKDNELEDALMCLQKATGLEPALPDAFWNLNCVMRRLGRKEESVVMSREYIEGRLSRGATMATLDMRNCNGFKRKGTGITVACVKWGSKYGPEYVLRLFRGVRRHLRTDFRFICFTDDTNGLENRAEIECKKLPEGWQGWWNKAALFGPLSKWMSGRVLYVDLDTVVTGPLDDLCRCSTRFAILSTKNLDNEGKDFSNGLNSSLVLWNAEDEEIGAVVHDQLRENFDVVHRFIHRFDHWLELTISNPCIIQDAYPHAVVEFKHACEKNVPQDASIVIFPLHPKPHQCLDIPWVREHWLVDEIDETKRKET